MSSRRPKVAFLHKAAEGRHSIVQAVTCLVPADFTGNKCLFQLRESVEGITKTGKESARIGCWCYVVELGHFLWVLLHFLKSLQFLPFSSILFQSLYKNELYREQVLLSLFLEWSSQGLSSPRYSMVRVQYGKGRKWVEGRCTSPMGGGGFLQLDKR